MVPAESLRVWRRVVFIRRFYGTCCFYTEIFWRPFLIIFWQYRKIPKISPRADIIPRPFLRGLFLEGLIFGGAYVRREICVSKSIRLDCSGRKFTIFALFCFVFEGKFQVQGPRRAYIQRGDLTEVFLRYDFGGLIFGGAYFRNFTVSLCIWVIKCENRNLRKS